VKSPESMAFREGGAGEWSLETMSIVLPATPATSGTSVGARAAPCSSKALLAACPRRRVRASREEVRGVHQGQAVVLRGREGGGQVRGGCVLASPSSPLSRSSRLAALRSGGAHLNRVSPSATSSPAKVR
jgi:hypothetical protein